MGRDGKHHQGLLIPRPGSASGDGAKGDGGLLSSSREKPGSLWGGPKPGPAGGGATAGADLPSCGT